MPSEFYNSKRLTYQAQRNASNGASITLVCASECYVASFECAERVYKVVPNLALFTHLEVTTVNIPIDKMQDALTKLSQVASVALVDHVRDKHKESRFHCVWKIPCVGVEKPIALDKPAPKKPSINLEDY